MPPAWVAKNSKTAPGPKGTHARRKSEGSPSFVLVKEKGDGQAASSGKKKRSNIPTPVTPGHSKLSALAPSFEFVPRSATSPNLSAYTRDSDAAQGSDQSEHRDTEGETDAGEHTSSDEATSQDPSSLGSFLASSFSLSTPSSLSSIDTNDSGADEAERDPAEGLVDEKLAAETVSSAGPQADEFVEQSLTQSESGARPDADQTGFSPISGAINESPLADLAWKEKMGWWREDYAPKIPRAEEHDNDVEEEEERHVEKEEEKPELAPPAVEANSNETPLFQFPPWTPPTTGGTSKEDESVDLSDSTVSPAILSEVLPNSFTDSASPSAISHEPSTVQVDNASDATPVERERTHVAEQSESKTERPSLSSFLPSSFTPPLSGYPSTSTSFDSSFLSQDELRAEKLAHDGPADPAVAARDADPEEEKVPDMPLSAEAVASQPTLDDVLDVEEVPTEEAKPEEEKEVRKGWWNADETNETEKPQVGQAEHSDSMVDPQLAKETVESAGAQADGFVEKGFEEVDRISAEAQDGETEIKKEAGRGVTAEESYRDVVDVEEPQTRAGNDTSTPLGSFLSSAFQPTDMSFSATNESESVKEETTGTPANEPESSSSPTPVASTSQPQEASSTTTPPIRRRSSSPPPPERRPSESHAADSAPSLTLAISSAWHTAPWSRKLWAIIASVAINVGLPFVNGVMLGTLRPAKSSQRAMSNRVQRCLAGFGELFARNVLGVRFGWPLHNDASTTGSSARANTGGVGLRSAGAYKTSNVNGGQGVATDVPGHAGAKTALEGVVESVAE